MARAIARRAVTVGPACVAGHARQADRFTFRRKVQSNLATPDAFTFAGQQNFALRTGRQNQRAGRCQKQCPEFHTMSLPPSGLRDLTDLLSQPANLLVRPQEPQSTDLRVDASPQMRPHPAKWSANV